MIDLQERQNLEKEQSKLELQNIVFKALLVYSIDKGVIAPKDLYEDKYYFRIQNAFNITFQTVEKFLSGTEVISSFNISSNATTIKMLEKIGGKVVEGNDGKELLKYENLKTNKLYIANKFIVDDFYEKTGVSFKLTERSLNGVFFLKDNKEDVEKRQIIERRWDEYRGNSKQPAIPNISSQKSRLPVKDFENLSEKC